MRVLVIGGGGREHALCWALRRSAGVSDVYAVPGNPGMLPGAEPVKGDPTDFAGLTRLVRQLRVDLTVVGPEAPLCAGLVDFFEAQDLCVFGPRKAAAQLEGSKVFAKAFMARHNIPTARGRVFDALEPAVRYVDGQSKKLVVKADGLAGGKGAFVCDTAAEAKDALEHLLVEDGLGPAGRQVVVEERLAGEECSYMVLCDGERIVPLASSQDHKRLQDEDRGPNTGGMGAYSPAPVVTSEVEERIMDNVIVPALNGMAAEGNVYRGVLYAGLMIRDGLPFVLEFNCRFGDPETQPVLMRLKEDLAPLLHNAACGSLEDRALRWDSRSALCVVMASDGYPGEYEKGFEIAGLDEVEQIPDVKVFAAGVATDPEDGSLVTAGGRVLGVTALGERIADAQMRAYDAVGKINWQGAHYRRDIGAQAVARGGC
jgi:phosphoribosylamine--glycine ligase